MTKPTVSVGRDVVVSCTIAASPEEIFDFFIDLEKLTRWMGHDGEIVAEKSGVFRLRVTDTDWAVGEYVEIDRPHRVAFTWGWDRNDVVPPGSSLVTVTITDDNDSGESVVTLTHSGLCVGQEDAHEQGWTYFVGRLSVAGAGGEAGPQKR